MSYTFSIENGADNFAEIEPLYRQHYGELKARMESEGIVVAPFAMRLDLYLSYWRSGFLVNYVARKDGAAVGYANIYLTHSMHTGQFIAVEDAIYMLPAHRNGTGRKLAKFVLADLQGRGCQSLKIDSRTDHRAVHLWQRMGFQLVGFSMTYTFQGTKDHVQ